ncbi:MAG: hypothetical protein GY799_13500, partial [Desulfobulbaceae bacterium]|nr:hypothetical protein [Desulfobulbaceae bacterium]
VKLGKVSKEHGRLYNQLFEARQEGDYIDFVQYDEDTVKPWIPEVKNLPYNMVSFIGVTQQRKIRRGHQAAAIKRKLAVIWVSFGGAHSCIREGEHA